MKPLIQVSAICLLLAAAGLAQTVPDAGWPQTESRLMRLLSGDSEQKRTALAEIRGLRTEQASRLALPALRDNNEVVRATAAGAVVFLPQNEAAAALLSLLDDKRPFVRREAAYALGQVGNSSATGRLRRLLDSDRDPEVRSAAAIALGNIADPSAIDSLLQVLRKAPDEDNEFLRRSAARSIGQIFDVHHGGDTYTLTPQNFLPPKFKDLGSDQPQQAVGISSVVPLLSQVLENPKEADDTRREAAYALGAVRHPASATLLRSYIDSPDPYLAEISKEALLKLENKNKLSPGVVKN
jgi:HEAT repeat protein